MGMQTTNAILQRKIGDTERTYMLQLSILQQENENLKQNITILKNEFWQDQQERESRQKQRVKGMEQQIVKNNEDHNLERESWISQTQIHLNRMKGVHEQEIELLSQQISQKFYNRDAIVKQSNSVQNQGNPLQQQKEQQQQRQQLENPKQISFQKKLESSHLIDLELVLKEQFEKKHSYQEEFYMNQINKLNIKIKTQNDQIKQMTLSIQKLKNDQQHLSKIFKAEQLTLKQKLNQERSKSSSTLRAAQEMRSQQDKKYCGLMDEVIKSSKRGSVTLNQSQIALNKYENQENENQCDHIILLDAKEMEYTQCLNFNIDNQRQKSRSEWDGVYQVELNNYQLNIQPDMNQQLQQELANEQLNSKQLSPSSYQIILTSPKNSSRECQRRVGERGAIKQYKFNLCDLEKLTSQNTKQSTEFTLLNPEFHQSLEQQSQLEMEEPDPRILRSLKLNIVPVNKTSIKSSKQNLSKPISQRSKNISVNKKYESQHSGVPDEGMHIKLINKKYENLQNKEERLNTNTRFNSLLKVI